MLCVRKMLQYETDAEHGPLMTQNIDRLAEYGIGAEHKSIYHDI